jgi:uncharacterized protein (DUF58 family)
MRKLERLALSTQRRFAGQMKGENRSTRRGASIEFADYREYALGDDLRYVDWNMAARLDKLFIRLFMEEEDLFLALLVDTSASMGFGTPSKLLFSARLAAALGYIGLSSHDRVQIAAFAGGTHIPNQVQRGRVSATPFFKRLSELQPGGTTSLASSLKQFAAHTRARGIAIVLSDLMDPEWQSGVKSLLARGFHVLLVHVLDDEEVKPTLTGDLRLIDSETGETRELSINPGLLARYEEAVTKFRADAEEWSQRFGVEYIGVTTSKSIEDILFGYLRKGGLVR